MSGPPLAAQHIELVVFGLLVVVAGLAVLARVTRVPYPILLVLGGLAIGFVPGVPDVELKPDLVLLIFLPPLLYSAAFFASLVELRNNVRPIGLLAIGLVLTTMVGIAVVAHAVVGLSWSVSFVLGAVVSPTDAVAPSEILRRLSVPRRVLTIVEGENLTNDWTALVLYRFAVAAVVSGGFSVWKAGLEFVLTGLGGVAIGVAVGWLIAQVRRRLDDPPTEITISLLTGYAAYLPAEELGASGVLAAVTVGVFLGWRAPELTTATTRMELFAIWEMLQFLLNAVLFVMIGLQLPRILDELSGPTAGELAGWGVLLGALVIAIRVAWVFAFYLPRWLSRRLRGRDPPPPWKEVFILSWAGMRGAVSLAAALAIPLRVHDGGPFPQRELVIFLAFCVLLATLVVQGLTLAPLIRTLGVEDDGLDRDEELAARLETAYAAMDRLEELKDEDWVYDDTIDRARRLYDFRRRRFASRIDGTGEHEDRSAAYQRLQRELIDAQRAKLVELRNAGRISDGVRRAVERDLDLEESRLEG